jgi:putative DNA methylase
VLVNAAIMRFTGDGCVDAAPYQEKCVFIKPFMLVRGACFSLPKVPARALAIAGNYWGMPDYQRHLPHCHPRGAYLFVTWRLEGWLPAPVPDVVYATPGHRFAAEDRALAHGRGSRWLEDSRVADKLMEVLQAGERENLYELSAWVIMPNHVHILILPISDPRRITHSIKGRSAREANLLLGRTGPFWQHESYDHFVRSRKEFDRAVNYIEQNPVSAGFATTAENWRFSSAIWTS